MQRKIKSRNQEKNTIKVIVVLENEENAKVFEQEFRKMIRRYNHLSETKVGFELTISTSCEDKCSHQEV